MATRPETFVPALLVVDMQEDFLPPNGSLAVPDGRSTIPVVNELLSLPFAVKIATKDHHPPNHISFAANHPAPNNVPFASSIDLVNPQNPAEVVNSRLWPVHCVQNTPGWEHPPELDTSSIDHTVLKGTDESVEQYSAFAGPFVDPPDPRSETELARLLREKGVTHLYVVGLALDYCVKESSAHGVERGFKTFVVREGARGVDCSRDGEVGEWLAGKGATVVGMEGEEVGWVRGLKG